MNIGNPYSYLVSTIRKQGAVYNSPSVQLGKVVSVSPLAVTIGELQLTKDNLLLADYLKEGYSRDMEAGGSLNTYISKGDLETDDVIALIQVSTSSFLILCKAVAP